MCKCLALSGFPSWHTTKLDADEKRVMKRYEAVNLIPNLHPNAPKITLVAESGLYKLIMRWDKPVAAQFQNWVSREVLPSIRRTGGYVTKDADVEAVLDRQPSNPARAEVDLLRSVMSTIGVIGRTGDS